jgi:hypothetical protein
MIIKWEGTKALTLDVMGQPDNVDVLQIHGGDGDGAELVFDCNSQRIAVSIFPGSSTQDQNQVSTQGYGRSDDTSNSTGKSGSSRSARQSTPYTTEGLSGVMGRPPTLSSTNKTMLGWVTLKVAGLMVGW